LIAPVIQLPESSAGGIAFSVASAPQIHVDLFLRARDVFLFFPGFKFQFEGNLGTVLWSVVIGEVNWV